ncbi:efflux RND transporter periplasmic adaptor subunit [Vibrio breoganii]|uniref:efflux RND transporter periplasmic adaptor subunit n=1 Tax=Vibrio breoganii TaxID=553239 RepID=UPI003BAE187B
MRNRVLGSYFTRAWVIPVCLFSLTACDNQQALVAEPESRPAKLITVSAGSDRFERVFPASTLAGDKAVLAFRVSGQVINLPIKTGQKVNKGDLLGLLNQEEYALFLAEAEAEYALASVQLERAKKLIADRVISEQDYDQAVAAEQVAKATYEQARANFQDTRLVAPFDGTISMRHIDNFEYLEAKQSAMNIQSDSLLRVVFQLPNSMVNRVKGADAKFSMQFDSYSGETFPLVFQEIDTESDSSTGNYKVTMVMERPDDIGIMPGMSGDVTLSLPRANPSTLPDSSVFPCEENWCVWRIDEESRTAKTPVILAENGQLISGLDDGDQIVLSGVNQLSEGMKVREWIKEKGL